MSDPSTRKRTCPLVSIQIPRRVPSAQSSRLFNPLWQLRLQTQYGVNGNKLSPNKYNSPIPLDIPDPGMFYGQEAEAQNVVEMSGDEELEEGEIK